MKIQILIFLMALSFVNSVSQELTVMTYNIRLDVASDGENSWPNRKENLVGQLAFYAPDIFGIQEGMPHQVAYINQQFPNYSFIGKGRDGENRGEYAALFFNTEKYSSEQYETFWLSETPNVVSKGWDAAFPRVCTYGLFVNKKTGINFFVFNTHLDHIGSIARENSLALILQKIAKINTENLPVILMGDFNLEPQSESISNLKKKMNDSREITNEKPFGPKGTFNAFNFENVSTKRIDYIFVSKSPQINVQKYGVLNNSYEMKYPSDHFPVYIKMFIKN